MDVLNLRERPDEPALEPVPLGLTAAHLGRRYFPARGFPYSLLLHEIALFGLLLSPGVHHRPLDPGASPPEPPDSPFEESTEVLYLPLVGPGEGGSEGAGGGSEGGGGPASPAAGPAGQKPSSGSGAGRPAGAAAAGLSYPGPQPILSAPPDPTNTIQTLLQPALENAPILPPPLALPNIVQIADAGPVPKPSPPEPALPPPAPDPPPPAPATPPAQPPAPAAPPAPVEPPPPAPPPVAPEAPAPPEPSPTPVPAEPPPPVAPAAPERDLPAAAQPEPKPPEPAQFRIDRVADVPAAPPVPAPTPPPPPEPPPAAQPVETPKAPPLIDPSPSPTRGEDAKTVLALSPLPAKPDAAITIPAGVARGLFAISPEPNLATSENQPGSRAEPAAVAGIGQQGKAAAGSAAGSANDTPGGPPGPGSGSAPGTGTGSGPGTGAGAGAGSGPGKGAGPGAFPGVGTGSGPGTGAGSGAGPGTGAGPGSTAGPGRGTGTGSGKPAFAGITILGGGSATGAAGRGGSRIGIARPLRTSSYGVTILSTKRTGGGLADYGVFSQEPVYTVYLDMRKAATDRGHSWTLEYAVLREAAPATGGAPPAVRTLQGLVLPFPAVKERPPLPAELVHRHPEKLVVVYGVIDVEGKLGQLAVKDTPDPQINEPLLAALAGWVFRPAELNGARVAVKMLMGIPLCPESIDGPAAP